MFLIVILCLVLCMTSQYFSIKPWGLAIVFYCAVVYHTMISLFSTVVKLSCRQINELAFFPFSLLLSLERIVSLFSSDLEERA